MKTLNKIILLALGFLMFNACTQNYIDDISKVEPGPDQSAPTVNIIYPSEGTQIQKPEAVSSVNIEFEATDDIELGSVKVMYDGTEIASYTSFKDYRKLMIDTLLYTNVLNGTHKLTVVATDLDNKSTSKEVNFEKIPPYIPKYSGEVLYMPFDGDYMDMISFQTATVVGNPGFSDDKVAGLKSYKGAADSYLTFPTAAIQNSELTAVFWMKINAVPDRAGILVASPENDIFDDSRKFGFRFFREAGGGLQQFKLNAGNGTAESWFDGGANARVDPSTATWHHFAFTISSTEAVVYVDGQVVSQGAFDGIDWTGCDLLSIMSGDPRFSTWNHHSDEGLLDELRIFNRSLTQEEIQGIITDESGKDFTYSPKYDGEIFYMPFEDDYLEYVSQNEATKVGTPGFADGKVGKAYAGATDSYLTFPTDELQGNQFSAVMWFKINNVPDRAGILVMGPEDTGNANYPDIQNNRKSGFRFFREVGAGTNQRFKLNAGNGTADTWVDGGTDADVDPTVDTWHHLAFTISDTECNVFIDGNLVKNSAFTGIDWTGCDLLTIMSGVPRFTEWSHFSDLSLLDELRLFNKALTQEEIQGIMADEN